ncbi:MAG: hypothetical protein HWQ44_13195 [Nostoc sp. JL34]|uniref:hypothetical protein n=1 Tax=Nostoc sp. JL34 TaxID=2815397 RepID=UPI001D68F125|nr:hypothetical protein [Nostoc sp. JL34]MBN3883895.1 hypothetical protein [Nostoc sp. JL34]
MSQYPIILIPVGIERAKSVLPPAPIPPDPPQQPGTKPLSLALKPNSRAQNRGAGHHCAKTGKLYSKELMLTSTL